MHNPLLEKIQTEWVTLFKQQAQNNSLAHTLSDSEFDGTTVYLDSHHAALFNQLKATYPLCQRLVGDSFWYALLHRHIKSHPSTQQDINTYGDTLPDFVANFEPAKSLPYLQEICAIEWHWHVLKLISPTYFFDFESFVQLNDVELQTLCFHLSPALKIVSSQYPIYQIWAMNYLQQDKEIQLNDNPETILLYQSEDRPSIMRLNQEESIFLQYLSANHSLPWNSIANELGRQLGEDKLGETLTKALCQQWINHFSIDNVTTD